MPDWKLDAILKQHADGKGLKELTRDEAATVLEAVTAAGTIGVGASSFLKAVQAVHSPSWWLNRSRAGGKIYEAAQRHYFEQEQLEHKLARWWSKANMGLSQQDRMRIGLYRDGRQLLDHYGGDITKVERIFEHGGEDPALVVSIQDGTFLDARLQKINDRWNEIFEWTRQQGIKEGFLKPDGQQIDNYLPFYFDRMFERKGVSKDAAAELAQELGIDVNLAYQILEKANPKNVKFGSFDMERLGWILPGMRDPEKRFEIYHKGFARKIAVTRFLRVANPLNSKIQDPQLRDLAHKYINQYAGRPLDGGLSPIDAQAAGWLTGIQYMAKIGFNPWSPVLNLTQTIINTVPAMGLWRTGVAAPRALAAVLLPRQANPFIRDLAALELGGVLDTWGAKFERPRFGGPFDKVQRAASFFFDKTEQINRSIAFLAGMDQASARGLRGQKALDHARDVVRQTQFYSGRLDAPLFARTPLGKVVMQFKVFTFKELEFIRSLSPAQQVKFAAATIALGGPAAFLIVQFFREFFPEWPITELLEQWQETYNIAAMLHLEHLSRQLGVFAIPGVNDLGDRAFSQRIVSWMVGPTANAIADTLGALGEFPKRRDAERVALQVMRAWAPGGVEATRVVRAMNETDDPVERLKILIGAVPPGQRAELPAEIQKLLR